MRVYRAYSDKNGLNACSRASEEFPLEINCAGDVESVFPFTTHNPGGRKDYYFLYLASGELEVTLPSKIQTVSAGTVLIFPPGYSYRYVYQGKGPLRYLWAHFTGSYADRFLRECGMNPLPFCRELGESRAVAEQFERMLILSEGNSPRLRQELSCAMEQVILTTARAITVTEKQPLERSLHRMHSAFWEELRIPDLAAMENLSHSRYITLFRRQTGVSPTAYLIGLRMEHACYLLSNTDMSIKQIGISVGYEDPQFFSKLFKKHVGVSPLQYRKTC